MALFGVLAMIGVSGLLLPTLLPTLPILSGRSSGTVSKLGRMVLMSIPAL